MFVLALPEGFRFMDFLIAVALWLIVLINPYAFDSVKHLTPDQCTFFEDGATVCETFTLPAYDELVVR